MVVGGVVVGVYLAVDRWHAEKGLYPVSQQWWSYMIVELLIYVYYLLFYS
jgi:hypothetical protein